MKHSAKKLSVILLVLACVVCLTVSLVACNDGEKGGPTTLSAPVIDIDEGGVISWAAVENALSYTVQEGGEDVATVKEGLSYTIAQTTPGTYSYTVTAIGDGEKYLDSKPSEAKSYTVTAKLAKPVLKLEGNVLSWDAVQHATAYDVYEGGGIVAEGTTETQYTIPSKELGEYSYTVVAKGDGNVYFDSYPSEAAVFTVGKLATPSGFALNTTYQPPRITWTEVEGAAGYSVTLTYNGTAGEAQTVQSASCAIEADAYGTYSISVIALAGEADAAHKNSDAGTGNFTYSNTNAPALTAPTVEKRNDGYTLIWDAVAGATSYNVYMGDELVATVQKDALINISEDASQEIWKVYYEAVPKDFDSVGQSVSYKVAALGDGINFKDSQKSSAVDIFRFNQPYLTASVDALTWYRISDIGGYGFADTFEIYCNGELEDTITARQNQDEIVYSIPVDEKEPGYYLYHVIAKDSNGKHLPSYASSDVIYNLMDYLSEDTPVKFAIKQYQEIFIDLDYAVALRKWYDFEIKIVDSSLEDLSTLSAFTLDIWGNRTVDDTSNVWAPFYENGVSATDNVFKASIVPFDDGVISVQISYMQSDLNADYVVLEISMKENTELEPVETFPGKQPEEGELSVEGVLGLSVYDEVEWKYVGSTITVHYLKGFDHVALPLDIDGSTGSPLVAGKTYQMQIQAFYDQALDYGYQISDSTQMGYAFDESAFEDMSYQQMTVQYSFQLICEFTLEEGVDTIYILNLNEGTNAHLTIRVIESEGGSEGGGGESSDALGIGNPVTVDITSSGTIVSLADGTSGDMTISLSGTDLGFFNDEDKITFFIGAGLDLNVLNKSNNFTLDINIPAGVSNLTFYGEAYSITITLSNGGQGGEGGNELGAGKSVTVDLAILGTEIALAAGTHGDFTITLSGDGLNDIWGDFGQYIELYIGDGAAIALNESNQYTASITIPEGTVSIKLVPKECMPSGITVTLSGGAGGGGSQEQNNELGVDSPVTVDINDTYVPFEIQLASGLDGTYTITLSGEGLDAIIGEYTFFAITVNEDTAPDDGIKFNADFGYSQQITLGGLSTLYIFGISCKGVVTVTLSGGAGGSEEQESDELAVDSPVTLEDVSETTVKLAESVASRTYALTLTALDEGKNLAEQIENSDITITVDGQEFTLIAGLDGSYTGMIEIPEGATSLTIKIMIYHAYNVTVTLSNVM